MQQTQAHINQLVIRIDSLTQHANYDNYLLAIEGIISEIGKLPLVSYPEELLRIFALLAKLPEISYFIRNADSEIAHYNISSRLGTSLNLSTPFRNLDAVLIQENYDRSSNEELQHVLAGEKSITIKSIGDSTFRVHNFPICDRHNSPQLAVRIYCDLCLKPQLANKLNQSVEFNMLNTIKQVVLQTDFSLRILYVNKAWLTLMGAQPEFVLGKDLLEFVHPQFHTHIKLGIEQVRTQQTEYYSTELRLITNHRGVIYAELGIKAQLSDYNILVGYVITLLDTHTNKLSQNLLSDSKLKYTQVLEALPDSLLVLDHSASLVELIKLSASLNFLKTHLYAGQHISEIMGVNYAQKVGALIQSCRENGAVSQGEIQLQNNEGNIVVCEIRLITYTDKHVLCILKDTTAIFQAEVALKNAEKRWSLAFEANKDGIWDWDLASKTVFISKSWVTKLGFKNHIVCEADFLNADRIFEDDRLNFTQKITDYLSGKTPIYSSEYRLQNKRNQEIWILDRGKVVEYTASQKPSRIIGSLTNITDQKKKEKLLHEHNVTKDKFFSLISHDLRSPFNAIMGFSEMLIVDYETLNDTKRKQYANYIHQVARSTYNLLENLLTWSRSQRGLIPYNPSSVNMCSQMHEIIDQVQTISDVKRVSIVAYIPPETIAWCDKIMVAAIIRNLLSNAVKFSFPNQMVQVSVNRHPDYLQILVRDQGVGMSAEVVHKLFDLTSTSSTPGTNNEKGSGLGLILCKEFVERNHGQLTVKSEIGIGTEFSFTLPLKESRL